MGWTFKHATTDQSFEAWGFTSCQLTKLNQDKGAFTAQIAGDARASLPFTYGDAVELRLDGVVKWKGYFITAKRREAGSDEVIELRFDDLWHKLEQAPFVGGFFGTVLFGSLAPGISWTPAPLETALAEIVAEADGYHGGGLMQAGTLNAVYSGLQPPPTGINGKTCADALRTALRKAPGLAASWDYSTTPPTLNFKRRADGTIITLDLDPDVTVIDSCELLPRPDLQSRGVVITWLQEVQGVTSTVALDTAGETTGDNIIRLTFPLAPPGGGQIAATPSLVQTVSVVSDANDWNISSAGWWSTYGELPDNCTVVTVGGGTNSSGSSLERIWRSGTVPGWLNAEAHLGERVITGYLTLRFEDAESESTVEKQQIVRRVFQVTDLNGSYSRTVMSPTTASEDPSAVLQLPTYGIAAVMHAELSQLHYQGSVSTTREDIAHEVDVGDILRLSNGLAAYAAMNAQVYRVTYDFDTAKAQIEVGPSINLAPDDWASQQASLSRDPVLSGMEARGTTSAGGSGASGEVIGNTPPPPARSAVLGDGPIIKCDWKKGDYRYQLDIEAGTLKITHTEDISKQLLIDLEDAAKPFALHMADPEGAELVIKPRAAKMCVVEEGEIVEKKVMILMSDHSDNIVVPS